MRQNQCSSHRSRESGRHSVGFGNIQGNPNLFELVDKSGFPLVIGSPHIGASTAEGQGRVGQEVAQTVIEFYRSST